MDTSNNWYLVHTKARQEATALTHLQRQNYTAYLPMMHSNKRVRSAYQQVIEPMFARYLFISLSESQDDWGPIRSTRGVSGLVRFGGVAATVPAALVELIKQREMLWETKPPAEIEFALGDSVRIVDGVMQGYEGVVAEKNSTKRVTLLLEIVGKAARVDISTDAIVNLQ